MRTPLAAAIGCAILAALATFADASTLGRSIDAHASPRFVELLADVPADRLVTLHRTSELLALRRLQVLPAALVDPLLVESLEILARQQHGNSRLRWETWAVLVVLQSDVVGEPLREELARGAERPLHDAATAWIEAMVEAGEPAQSRGGGNDVDCFQRLVACMEGCSDLETFVQRSACGLDCSLALAGCVGRTLNPLTRVIDHVYHGR